MKSLLAILLLFVIPACGAEPRLILVVSTDQLRYDYLTRLAPLFRGGLKRMLDTGAVFSNALYRHAANETGPGHSVILSGRSGRSSGIVGNDWYDPFLKRTINVVADSSVTPVGGRGRAASPANFVGFTIGDKIKQKWPQSRVYGVSFKDRSAILMAGPRADGAFWYEAGCGCLITSTYYTATAPRWLTRFNASRPADRYIRAPWTRLLPDEAIYEQYSRKDDSPGEWDLKDTTFPHEHRGKPPEPAYYSNLQRTPFIDEILVEAAVTMLREYDLGRDASPDVLAVGFSATDHVGHTYGPFSQEAMDTILRLDLALGRLIDAVEARAGRGNYMVILTADHGVLPLVEDLQEQGIDAVRVKPETLTKSVQDALKTAFPEAGKLIASFAGPDVYFDLAAIHESKLTLEQVEAVAAGAIMSTGFVERVYTQAELMFGAPGNDPYFELFRNSFYAPRSPHLTTLLKPYVYYSSYVGGTGHGTAHDYDRHVPIVWMGPGIPAGTYPDECGPEDIAPTLGKMLGIEYPKEPHARLLTEILPPEPEPAAPAKPVAAAKPSN